MPRIRWLIYTKQDTKNEKTENGIRKTLNRITKRQKATKKNKNRIAKLNIETQIIWYFR